VSLLHVASNDAVYFCCAEDVDPKQALRSPVLAAPVAGGTHTCARILDICTGG
jgi:hypothetical protein